MARQAAVAVENNFTGGLVTEATGLNFPENACTDTDNCVFDPSGLVSRRTGFDFETNYTNKAITTDGVAITTYLWNDVSGDGDVSLLVAQIGATLYFYETNEAFGAISQGAIVDTVNLATYTPAIIGAPSPSLNECQFAQGLGFLFVFHPNLDPFFLEYDEGAQSITETRITVQIRDLEGLTENVAVDNRPAAITDTHRYNLYNQGWDAVKVSAWDTARADFPSNADLWWYFKNTSEVFDVATVADRAPGNSQAPRGHFILDAFDQQRDAASGIASIPEVTTSYQRPTTGTFHAGRVWYAGTNFIGYNGKIYYTQIIENERQVGYCYGLLDPSSEELSDLLPTDGGVINIPEAGTVHKLWSFNNYLLVFGSAGIWAISGSQGLGFSATDYSVSQISSVSSISATSFVDVQGTPVFWAIEGIFTVVVNKDGGLVVQSLSDKKIRSFFEDIPTLSKKYARGAFNPFTNTIQWIYTSTATADITEIYEYDSFLNYDTTIGCFYPWSVEAADVKIHGMFIAKLSIVQQLNTDNVIDGAANQVINSASDNVVVFSSLSPLTAVNPKFKYLVSYPSSGNKVTWADSTAPSADQYLDWMTYGDGVGYTSYFTTGYRIKAQGAARFQSNYLFMFADTSEEDSEYTVRSLYDFTTSAASGRWSTAQTFTHTAGENYGVVRKKILLRGHGVAVQFKVTSVSGEPFNFIGWAVYDTANSMP